MLYDNTDTTESSGNVFSDLDLPDVDDPEIKVRLAIAVNRAIAERGLSQAAAARLFGTSQSRISTLANYKLNGLSAGRLMEFLTVLGRDVEVRIRPARGHGRIVVSEEA